MDRIMTQVRRCAKALVGFVAPGAVLVIAAVQEGSPGDGAITSGEWWTIAAVCVATSGGVYVTGPRGGRVDS
jgi:hypothetical protein